MHQHLLQLFLLEGLLESIAMEILGPLAKTNNSIEFIVVVADRYFKLTRAIRTKTSIAIEV